ncbi:DUF7146 domain-containing protein [Azonexus hydrophilus]|uniref:Toprim domain-containing protein n=1 Tax=Azonexus hydrophilus TaxID=418702 RepID=A0ABZ2XQ20_9RHOO
MSNIMDDAFGRWRDIHIELGIDEKSLDGFHHPCPACGGRDRFRYDKKDDGSFFCSGCGPGDGMSLVMRYRNMTFLEAKKEVQAILGITQEGGGTERVARVPRVNDNQDQRDVQAIRKKLQKVANECQPVTKGDPVWKYLRNTRMLDLPRMPLGIRFHPGLEYWHVNGQDDLLLPNHEEGKLVKLGVYPAMVAIVRAPDGRPVCLHRTFLTPDGRKADVPKAKKLMKSLGIEGGAIRLSNPQGTILGVAEGIESALAASVMTGQSVWAAVSATILKKFVVPQEVEHLVIFADNDKPDEKGRRAGQEAAKFLHDRVVESGKKCSIITPSIPGTDMWDVYEQDLCRRKAA